MLSLFSVPIKAQPEQDPWVQLAASDLKAIQEALSKHTLLLLLQLRICILIS
jgi:hypothetical protein